jgi:hypothetical protein
MQSKEQQNPMQETLLLLSKIASVYRQIVQCCQGLQASLAKTAHSARREVSATLNVGRSVQPASTPTREPVIARQQKLNRKWMAAADAI